MWDNMWVTQGRIPVPKRARELTALAVSKLKAEGRYAVGGAAGLHLRVAGNSRTWVLRIKVAGRRRDMGLGAFPEVSLAEARQRALEQRKAVARGIDPIEERQAQRAREAATIANSKTFEESARAYIEAHATGWKSAKHAAQWTATLETYAFPILGKLPVAAVDTARVLQVLTPIWTSKTETASRLRGRIESILDWAKVRGYRQGENPARWKNNLRHQLPARSKVQKVQHHAALPYVRVGAFMADLRKREGMSPRALEFVILTAARSGEVRGATWREINLKILRWTIPASRMKREKEHVVPLSPAAVKFLNSLPRIAKSDFVFPAPRGGELSDAAMGGMIDSLHDADLKRGGVGYLDPSRDKIATPHGFRSSFRDWAAEVAYFPSEVIEHALAHKLKDKAEAAYQRGTLLMKRAKLMEEWAKYCSVTRDASGKVIPLNRKKA
jgi:integrase